MIVWFLVRTTRGRGESQEQDLRMSLESGRYSQGYLLVKSLFKPGYQSRNTIAIDIKQSRDIRPPSTVEIRERMGPVA